MATYLQVGQFSATKSVSKSRGGTSERLGKNGGNVVTYVCTPKLEVLTWQVGPVSADEVLAAVDEARRLQAELRGITLLEERVDVAKSWYRDALHREIRPGFDAWDRATDDGTPSPAHLLQAINVARQLVGRATEQATQRLSHGPRGKLLRLPAKALASLVDETTLLQRNTPRIVLAKYPLVALDVLQKPVFERLANQRFRGSVEGNKAIAAIQEHIQAGRATIVIVNGSWVKVDAKEMPTHRELPDLLKSCGIVRVSTEELTALADQLDLPPFPSSLRYAFLTPTGEWSTFIRSDKHGFQTVKPGAGPTESTRALGPLFVDELRKSINRTPSS